MKPPLLSHPARLAGHSLLRMQSDERLTELARSGHEPAFAAIVGRYRPALVRYCTRLLGPDRAEDAVQQALANAHAALTRPDDDRPIQLRPWLYRVTHNAALNTLRAGTGDTLPTPDELAGGETPHEALARREQLDELLRAIAMLPAGQRDALLLRELEGRSHEEIADVLGLTRGAARQQLFRARAAVRAACTALTPAPLLARLLDVASSVPPTGGGGQLLAGVVTKATVGIVALGATAGGVTTGVVRHHHDAPPARAATIVQARTQAPAASAATPAAAVAAPAPTPTRNAADHSRSGDHGRRSVRGHGDGAKPIAAGEDDDHGRGQRQGERDEHGRSGDDDAERSGHDGARSGDDNGSRGSATASGGERDGDGSGDDSSGLGGAAVSGDDLATTKSGSGGRGESGSGSRDESGSGDESGSSGSGSGDD